MKSKQIRMITHGAILAALYVALTYLQNWLLPGARRLGADVLHR